MTPYYDDGTCQIWHGDVVEARDLAFTVLCTDPPYGFNAYPTDYHPDYDLLGELVQRARTAAVFGYPEALVMFCGQVGRPTEWVTWWPSNASCAGGLRGPGLPRESEHIAIFGDIPRVDLRRSRSKSGSKLRESGFAAGGDDARLGDVWEDAKPGLAFNSRLRQHPNEKPVSLLVKLVTLLGATSDDVVFDPFCGSGSTLRAAKDLGIRAIGIEIDERYCEVAARRLAQEVLAL